ncbi:MAG: J domain-containing protein [Desulfobulbaceae bacterium]|nr:J domain-containing protein [Desulfobulbaceae bacterium]
MTRKEWQAIDKARKVLGLGERATLGEIKRAYYRLCKQYHPDAAGRDSSDDEKMMYRLTEAYDLLMRYCEEYRFPLQPGEANIYDAEDWWMDRFGQDPIWPRRK